MSCSPTASPTLAYETCYRGRSPAQRSIVVMVSSPPDMIDALLLTSPTPFLQRLCAVLKVPVSFFFEVPDVPETDSESAALTAVLATSDGVALMTGYARIRDPNVRRAIVALVEQIVAEPVATLH
jgi:hypothetical protein